MSQKPEFIKKELFSSIIETRTSILHEASQLSPTAQDTVFLGTWSVKDLIAHLSIKRNALI